MLSVSTRNLSADARTASAEAGSHDIGELDVEKLTALLEVFRGLDPLQNAETDPQIVVQIPRGKFIIRTNGGRLYLHDARNPMESAAELTAAQIVAQFDRPAAPGGPDEMGSAPEAEAEAAPRQYPVLATALFAAGLMLVGFVLYSVWATGMGNKPPALEPITDASELAACRFSVAGTYVTGQELGDYGIVVGTDGTLRFTELLGPGEQSEIRDTYRIGRSGSKTCLGTAKYGALIEISDPTTLVYDEVTYKRAD